MLACWDAQGCLFWEDKTSTACTKLNMSWAAQQQCTIIYVMYNADEVSDWVVRKGLQAKLEGVILKNLLRDMFYDGSSGADQVDHEEQLYQPIASAIYEPVNQAAQILGLPLRYSFSYGI